MNNSRTSSLPSGTREAAAPPAEPDVASLRARRRFRRWILAAIVLVLVQSAIGMTVNLFVTVPAGHPGARASNYLSGSFHSVVWAISHGAAALAVHASLGVALVVVVTGVGIGALRLRMRRIRIWTVLAGLLVIGAGFNGASFLDYSKDISSLIMALLAFGAVACYSVALFILST
jgi:hypothetical protein